MERGRFVAGFDESSGEAAALEEFKSAWLDCQRFTELLALALALHNPHLDIAPGEFDGGCQSDWAGSDDEEAFHGSFRR